MPRGERCATSRDNPQPVQFKIGERNVVPALEYGVLGMAASGKRSVRIAPQLAYYERQTIPNLPDGASLRYEVELVRISDHRDNAGEISDALDHEAT